MIHKFEREEHAYQQAVATVNLRCPACGHNGSFGKVGTDVWDAKWTNSERRETGLYSVPRFAGLRRCPNNECNALVFVAGTKDRLEACYPPEIIDFDPVNLPTNIRSSLEEAIKCHAAESFRASALMVRRVLEEVCEDKAAKGKDLKARLLSLQSSVLVPKELMDAADELRLMGNDAAHVDAKSYDDIGKDESALAIELAKELLKGVYQYASLLVRLRAFKSPNP